MRSELDGAVGRMSAHVGELFFFADIDIEIVFFVREADNHTLVDRDARRNEELATGLGGVEGVSGGGARFEGDKGAVSFGFIFSVGGAVATGEIRHNNSAFGGGHEMIAKADEGGSRDFVGEAGVASWSERLRL